MKTPPSIPSSVKKLYGFHRCFLLVFAALSFVAAASLHAQKGGTVDPPPLPPTIQVVTLTEMAEQLWWRSPEGMKLISPSIHDLGPQLDPPNGQFELFRRVLDEESEEFRYLPVGAARLLPKSTNQLLIILPYDKNRQIYPIQVFDHSLEAHPRNNIRFINLSPKPLAVKIMNDQPTIVQIGGSLFHSYPDKDLEKIQMHIAIESTQGWQKLAFHRFIVAPGLRFLFLGSPIDDTPGLSGGKETVFVLRKFVD